MPNVPPAGGSSGLPTLTTRAFQLIDLGYDVWTAFWTAFTDYVTAVVEQFGTTLTDDIGSIEV